MARAVVCGFESALVRTPRSRDSSRSSTDTDLRPPRRGSACPASGRKTRSRRRRLSGYFRGNRTRTSPLSRAPGASRGALAWHSRSRSKHWSQAPLYELLRQKGRFMCGSLLFPRSHLRRSGSGTRRVLRGTRRHTSCASSRAWSLRATRSRCAHTPFYPILLRPMGMGPGNQDRVVRLVVSHAARLQNKLLHGIRAHGCTVIRRGSARRKCPRHPPTTTAYCGRFAYSRDDDAGHTPSATVTLAR